MVLLESLNQLSRSNMETKTCFWERCTECVMQGCTWVFHESSPASCMLDISNDPDGIIGMVKAGGYCFSDDATTSTPSIEEPMSSAMLAGIIGGAIFTSFGVGALVFWGVGRVRRLWRLRRFRAQRFWDIEPPEEPPIQLVVMEQPPEDPALMDQPPEDVAELAAQPGRTIADRIREAEQQRAEEHRAWMERIRTTAEELQNLREERRERDREPQRLVRQLLNLRGFADVISGRLPQRRAIQ